jgi:aryl carrier-like protein
MSGSTAGEPLTRDDLRGMIAAMVGLEPDAVADDANLLRLGVDSLGIMRLVNRLRRAGVRVSYRDISAEPTLTSLGRHLANGAVP